VVNNQGNIGKVFKDLGSKDSLKKLAVSVISAGMLSSAGLSDGVASGMKPSVQEVVQERASQSLFNLETLTNHLKCNLVRGGVQATADLVTGEELDGAALLKNAATNTIVDAVGEHLAGEIKADYLKEKFGAVEHKVLHGALGAFSGALLNPEDPLYGAASGALSAFVAESAAEILAGQQTSYTLNEYIDECGRNGTAPTQNGFYDYMLSRVIDHPERDALVLRGNIAKVVGAAAAFAAKLDPSTAFRTAENAIENNFLFMAPWVYAALAEAGAIGLAAWKANDVWETCADAYDAYEKGGIEGLSWFVAEEGALRFATGKAGKAVVMVGGKAFASAKRAAQALLERHPSLAANVADLGAITRGLELKLAHAMQDYSGGSKKMTANLNEVHARLGGAKGAPKVNGGGSKNIISQPEVVRKSPGLIHTPLSKQARQYIVDMEKRSGIAIQEEQRSLLNQALKQKKFEKLSGAEKVKHANEYNPSKRESLISQWEKKTGAVWPKYPADMKNAAGGIHDLAGKGHQLHHIIPQQVGGPHKWWNIHPLKKGADHQGGVHGAGSALNKMLKGQD
jgi:hypothetical protein